MSRSSRSCSKLCRFIAERLVATSTTVPVIHLVIAGLAALVILSSAACGSSPSKTPPKRTRPIPTLTHTSTPTATPTQIPTLLPSVMLEEPVDGSCLAYQSDATLRWICSHVLQGDEYYRVRVKGQNSPLSYCREKYLLLRDLLPGEYKWNVAIVRSTAQDKYEPVSEESDWYSFEVLPPTPVVHTISPTSTVQGAPGVIVTVTGENFTHSLALTIGVPLRAIFVNSSTITATVPATLEVGEHPVIVKDSAGEGMSTVSFVVREPVPTPTPQILSTKTPMYPPPELIGLDILGCNVTFRWSWHRVLAEDEYYAVRFDIGGPGHSKVWVKETQYTAVLTEPGECTWEVAVCQGELGTGICNQLAVSEQQTFNFNGCGGWGD